MIGHADTPTRDPRTGLAPTKDQYQRTQALRFTGRLITLTYGPMALAQSGNNINVCKAGRIPFRALARSITIQTLTTPQLVQVLPIYSGDGDETTYDFTAQTKDMPMLQIGPHDVAAFAGLFMSAAYTQYYFPIGFLLPAINMYVGAHILATAINLSTQFWIDAAEVEM